MTPGARRPYLDAAEVLAALRERGVAVGVVSDIGWDLRPVFRAHGLDRYVDTYALSYEHGVRKPDRRLFAAACTVLGADPARTLLVGDDRRADGGAADLGCGGGTSWTTCRSRSARRGCGRFSTWRARRGRP